MPEAEKNGVAPATMALIAVLALPVVLVLVFLLVGRVRSGQDAPLPVLESKGLKWAQSRAQAAGFDNLSTYDSLGRDRGQRDSKSWQVCFMTPKTGTYARDTKVEFGTVRLEETCPAEDLGRIDPAGKVMPRLIGRTTYMARVAFGEDASIRIVNIENHDVIDANLGDYIICSQEPAADQAWDGVPVKLAVVPYDHDCANPQVEDDDADLTFEQLVNEAFAKLS